jgi:biopolymer transport protein ExbD
MSQKLDNEPNLLIAVRCDEGAPYGTVEDVLEEFKDVYALNVQFTTKKVRS